MERDSDRVCGRVTYGRGVTPPLRFCRIIYGGEWPQIALH